MKKQLFLVGLCAASAFAADKPADPRPGNPVQTAMGLTMPFRVRVAKNQTTLFRLPDGQRIMNTYGGDKGDGGIWSIDAGKHPTRFLAVKPKEVGIHTTLHVISDTGEERSFDLEEITGSDAQFDPEVDITSTAVKPGSGDPPQPEIKWVPADEVASCKSQAEAAKAEAAEASKKAQAQIDAAIATYPEQYAEKMVFGYQWDVSKAERLGLKAGWHDDKFTYFKGDQVLALYEVNEDGQPSLIQYSYKNGIYTIPKIVYDGYFAIGKKKEGKVVFHLDRNAK